MPGTPITFTTYQLTVEVDEREAPGMQPIVDAVADMLEARGVVEQQYNVTVHGPPEARLVMTERQPGT